MPAHNGYAEVVIKGDIRITVPDSLNLMTPFVLREQQDWFEDEIKFLRSFISPGMKIIDIGANYGTYALTMAKLIGDSGRLWAFEPTTATADCLRQSVQNNKLKNITLIQAGLSNKTGTAKLYLSDNSELNTLSKESSSGGVTETIKLQTLDACFNQYKWRDIGFIKLDAEGEESNILKKGKNTLSSLSPLIMFELKHGAEINLPLISRFNDQGYDCYRLVPGLNILIPFSPDSRFDAYLLNLFACKADKAAELEAQGVIVRNWDKPDEITTEAMSNRLDKTPFWSAFRDRGLSTKDSDYLQVLNLYATSRSEENTTQKRLACLMAAFDGAIEILGKGEQGIERLVTFSRIAFDAGEREIGVKILQGVINKYHQNLGFEVNEPFFPACERYEDIVPGDDFREWLFSSVLEQYITKHAYSCYFSRDNILPLLGKLNELGFMAEEMDRRYNLLKQLLSQT